MAEQRLCSIDGCDKPCRKSNKLCHAHYRKRWKYGDPLAGRTNGEPTRLYLAALTHTGTECLIWPFGKNSWGYATYKIRNDGRTQILPRRICEDKHGPAPTKHHQAGHSCGKGHLGCYNPNHIRWVTPKQNIDDQRCHGTLARGAKKSTCILTEEQVREIRSMRGVIGAPTLAKRYNVSSTAIYSIWNGKKWKWLE